MIQDFTTYYEYGFVPTNFKETKNALIRTIEERVTHWAGAEGERFSKNIRFLNNIVHNYGRMTPPDTGYVDPFQIKAVASAVDYRFKCGISNQHKKSEMEYKLPPTGLLEYYNDIRTTYLKQRPTYSLVAYVDNILATLSSKSINNWLQYCLETGDFYDEHYTQLVNGVSMIGTGYTICRHAVMIDEEDSFRTEIEFDYEYLPVTRVITDGLPDTNDIRDSNFVIVLHKKDVVTAKEFFDKIVQRKVMTDGSTKKFKLQELVDLAQYGGDDEFLHNFFIGYHDKFFTDFDDVVHAYYSDPTLRTLYILEVFWKDIRTGRKYTSYYAHHVALHPKELLTIQEDDDFQLPIIPLYYHTVSESIYGVSPIAGKVESSLARSQLMNVLVNTSIRNSYTKFVYAPPRRGELKDTQGRDYIEDYRNQVFRFTNAIPPGEAPSMYIQQIDNKAVLDGQGLQLLDRFDAEYNKDYLKQQIVDPRRASTGAYQSYLNMVNEQTVIQMNNLQRYFKRLAEYNWWFSTKYLDTSDFAQINKTLGGGLEGLISTEYLDNVIKFSRNGIRTVLTDQDNATTMNIVERILPILQTGSGAVFQDPFFYNLLGLNKVVNLPDENDILLCKMRIQQIINDPQVDVNSLLPDYINLPTFERTTREYLISIQNPMYNTNQEATEAIKSFHEAIKNKMQAEQKANQMASLNSQMEMQQMMEGQTTPQPPSPQQAPVNPQNEV